MPFNMQPPTVAYPAVQTNAWIVISRLSETAVRVVPNLSFVNHASEFALPIPSGVIPYKIATRDIEVQKRDALGRPLYLDGVVETVEDSVSGVSLPPAMETVSEEQLVSLRDYPSQFTMAEVFAAVQADFLKAFPFYNTANLIVFDDRYDGASVYQDQQEASGLASGAHPLFIGPIPGQWDLGSTPNGHLLLVAPALDGIKWYYQRRYGIAGTSGGKGPISDIEHASRLDNIFSIEPMKNTPITDAMVTDDAAVSATHYWIRTGESGQSNLQRPYPIIPFIILLGRSTGSAIV